MARSSKSTDPYLGLNEPDPYLDLNGREGVATPKPMRAAVLADKAEKKVEKPKEPQFEPSMLRSVVAAIKGLTKRMEEPRDAKPPNVTIQAPDIKIPDITVNTPTKWKIVVTERDDNDRIKEMTIIAEK